jgi:uncharacterized membrane protein YfcA
MGQDNEQLEAMNAYISQASDINGQLVLLIFIAAILGLGKGGVPGFATVATALTVATAPLDISGGLGYAVSLQVPILAMIDISAAYLHSTSIDWYTTLLLLPLSFVGMAIGQVLDRFMTDALARILVGFILLAILTLKVWKDVYIFLFQKTNVKSNESENYQDIESHTPQSSRRVENKQKQSPPIPSKSDQNNREQNVSKAKTYMWACVVGLFGGAATMLTNSMGPILNVYLLSVRKLSPTEYIGTRAMFFCFLNVGKIPMRFASGALGWSMIPLAMGLGLVSVVGVFCAKPIMLSMKEETFVKLELIVVAFAGLRLMWLGLTMRD